MANAISVPSSVATSVAMRPTAMLVRTEEQSW